jgi:ABC-type nickel/cobalt efflux system permease component RcnA
MIIHEKDLNMEIGLMIIFWYGILHAFGPDHLTAIADFSIGKEAKKTFMIVSAFAVGHGIMLFMFAKILEQYTIPAEFLSYGDMIASSVIFFIGMYLLYLVYANKIHLKTHTHEHKRHIHIWFGNEHQHESSTTTSAFSVGVLMGIGGVRGMLVTLGVLHGQVVDFTMILAFITGVMVVFFSFGLVILWINKDILTNIKNVRRVFTAVGTISVLAGGNMLLSQ